MMSHKDRLAKFRTALSTAGLDGFIINRADMYQGEEVRAADERLAWLTGFTGSAGVAVILADTAAVFSDSRYHVQMERELDSRYFDAHDMISSPAHDWIKSAADAQDTPLRIGAYGWTLTKSGFDKLEAVFQDTDIVLTMHDTHPIDAVWDDRPDYPAAAPFFLDDAVSGRSSADKCEELASYLAGQGADYLLLTAPDSVNWLLNLRARDLACTPYFLSFALVRKTGDIQLITETGEAVCEDVPAISFSELDRVLKEASGSITLCDAARLPMALFTALKTADHDVRLVPDHIQTLKAVKNPAEIAGFKEAHIRDGCALVRFWHWFEQQDKPAFHEHQIAEQLTAFRSEDEHFICDSFPAIAGFGAHGAIVHYRAVKASDAALKGPGVLLLDSGGHYQMGTTDITRCFAVGTIDNETRRCSTAVFAAHANLAMTQFPEGTTGAQLDAICRAPLWAEGLDYGHGTGHGVGHILSVHEGPASIAPRRHDAIYAGYLLSNEPGTYKKDAFGIRHENLVLTVATAPGWLAFETLTLFPFDLALIDRDGLTSAQLSWLNHYHATVHSTLSPHLPPHLEAFLAEKCAPLH